MSNKVQKSIWKLFTWRTTLNISGQTFHVRIVGDSTIEEARHKGLLEARTLRSNLRNSNSEDYLTYLSVVKDLEDDVVIGQIVDAESEGIIREYVTTNPRPKVPELGDYPTQEEQEEREAAFEERERIYMQELEKYVENWRDKRTEGLQFNEKEGAGDLETQRQGYRNYLEMTWKKLLVDRLAEDRFQKVYENVVLSQCLFYDEDMKEPVFSSYDEFKSLPSEVKQIIKDAYNSINVSAEEIKK